MNRFLLIFILAFVFIISNAQSHLKFGEWKSYLPYKNTYKISESKNKIFCSTKLSLFSIDKEDFSIDFYDKINYLNDIDIENHIYDKFNNQLIIVYKSGNIDILTDQGTYNIPDIKNNLSILGKKRINGITIGDENNAYLAFDYGLTQFALKDYEFGFTCFTDFKINSVIQLNNFLYIGTDEGLYRFDLDSNKNAADIRQWDKLLEGTFQDLSIFNNSLTLKSEEYIFKLNNDLTTDTVFSNNDFNYDIIFAKASDNYLIIGLTDELSNKSKVVFIDKQGNNIIKDEGIAYINDVLIDNNRRIWITDKWTNIKWANNMESSFNEIYIDSPASEKSSDIKSIGDNIFVATGGANKINYTYDFTNDFYIFDGEKWNNYNKWSLPVIRDNSLQNFLTVEVSKEKETAFLGTFWGGLLEFNWKDNSAKLWNNENSKLDVAQGDFLRTRIADLEFDNNNNLWMTNFLSLKPLVVYTNSGEWYNFSIKNGENQIAELTIDQNDFIWIKIINNGLIIYDTRGTINDYTDDRQISINKSTTENMISNNVTALKTDLDGNVWVGTDQGPIVFECSGGIFEGNCIPTRKKTVLEGIAAYVLDQVNITSIEVDGANRKWIGSTSGLYVLSSSGEDELMHFTADNSPLFDNIITSLAYNGETGEIIIGTAKGIQSYKTKSLEGKFKNSPYAYAYPNPAPPDYTGPIAIKGLARDANVKITDITGKLVYETIALGGQAIWDAKDFNGNNVGSGVYIIFSTGTNNFDTPEAITLKIFIIR